MREPLKTLWPILAILVAAALIILELVRQGGPGTDSCFWFGVAGLILIMAGLNLFDRFRPPPPPEPPEQ